MRAKRVALWGTGAPSLQIYYSLNKEDCNDIVIVENNRELRENASKSGVFVYSLDEIDLNEIELFILPTYGINLVKKMRTNLIKKDLPKERILVISPKVFREEIAEQKSLSALIKHCKAKLPYINSLEFEVAHHCNLNCKGCNHFSPLSDVKFGNLNQFSKDLERIFEFVDHVGDIRLLGGEPLLNPELPEFVRQARRIDPNDPVMVMTNGLLLLSASDDLLATMKECNALFGITVYPPVRGKIDEITGRLDACGVKYKIFSEVDMFCGMINPDGDSDPVRAESVCFSSECHIFEDGYLTKCSVAHKYNVYSEHYGLKVDADNFRLNLYDDSLTAQKLEDYLLSPIEMCKYCGKWKLFNWEQASKDPSKEDWYCSGKYC